MKGRTPGQLFLEPVLFFGIVFLISCFATKLMTKREPAMVFRNMTISGPAHIVAGSVIRISYDYDKRADCTPPKGSGDFFFRIYEKDADGKYRSFIVTGAGNAALEPAGEGLHADNDVMIPSNLAAGDHAIAVRGIFQCQGEWNSQLISPPAIEFHIYSQ